MDQKIKYLRENYFMFNIIFMTHFYFKRLDFFTVNIIFNIFNYLDNVHLGQSFL